jgi:hypothetical protein
MLSWCFGMVESFVIVAPRFITGVTSKLPTSRIGSKAAPKGHIPIERQIALLTLNRKVALMLFQPRPNYLAHRTYHHLQNM